MYIKNKYKLMKKYEIDFWGVNYLRPRSTKFFIYWKKIFINKIRNKKNRFFKRIKLFYKRIIYKNEYYIRSHKNDLTLKQKNKRLFINYYIFFGRQGIGKSMYLYRKAIKIKFFRDDLILGINKAKKKNMYIKPKKKKGLFERKKLFLKQLIFFYNQLNFKKLKKLGYLASKSQLGSINTFFYFLECRIDNILMRFNLGSRFFIKNFIQAGNVFLNDKKIFSINYIVKNFCYVSFFEKRKKFVYKLLAHKLKYRLFFTQPPYYFEINYKILTFLIIPKFIYPNYIPYPFLASKSSVITGLHSILWGN